MELKPLFLLGAALCSLFTSVNAEPIGTTISYSGSLTDGGLAANAIYDMRFTLYNSETAGSIVGSTIQLDDVNVSRGAFTVGLDFGPGIFDGTALWIKVEVKRDNQAMYTALDPRQPLYPAPYALWAPQAGTADSLVANSIEADDIQAGAVTAEKIADNEVVKSLNGLKDAVTLSAGANITLTPSGNDIAIAATGGGNDWQLSGNTGTTPGTHFIGTTDNQPLELKVNNKRVLRLEPTASGAPNVVGGAAENYVASGIIGATISGGGAPNSYFANSSNSVSGNFGTIGGGHNNKIQINAADSTIGGGGNNTIQFNAAGSTIGGGGNNTIQSNASYSTIGGGANNRIQTNAFASTIGGGGGNLIQSNSILSTISGGANNIIQSNTSYSTIAGGELNTIGSTANYSAIGGGGQNTIEANAANSTIAGGELNTIQTNGSYSAINGGIRNINRAPWATIAGGSNNVIRADAIAAVIGGGSSNIVDVDASHSNIGGGLQNTIQGTDIDIFGYSQISTIGGGWQNTILSNCFQSVIAGGFRNTIQVFAFNSTVGGGADNIIQNGAAYSTVSGGHINEIRSLSSTIGGGNGNTIQNGGSSATIGGGTGNTIQTNAEFATIGGGRFNRILTDAGYATIGGGYFNTNDGIYATVPGGRQNFASANYTFAAGRRAKANNTGAFVWADSSDFDFTSTTANGFFVRCVGGVKFVTGIDGFGDEDAGVRVVNGSSSWTTLSDRNSKENLETVDSQNLLEKLAAIPIHTWNWKAQDDSIRHIGPMAQDFYAAFGVGEDERHITTVDADGVALAAIQGLNQKVEVRSGKAEGRIQKLEVENAELKRELGELKQLVSAITGKLNGGAK